MTKVVSVPQVRWLTPRRRRGTFYVFALLAGLAAAGAVVQTLQQDWWNAAAQAFVFLLLASIPWRLSRE